MKKIAVLLHDTTVSCFNISAAQADDLKKVFPDDDVVFCRNRKDFMSLLPEMETAIVWTFEKEWISSAVKLKKIITPAAGKDYLQWPTDSPIKVEYGSFHGRIIGETVLGMMYCHCRNIATAIRIGHSHSWPRGFLANRMHRFENCRVAILGFGHIGQAIGEKASRAGAKIIGIKKNVSEKPAWFTSDDILFSENDNWKDILPETDHLVLCLPFDEKTRNLINMEIFASLPSHSAIYNIGRGHCVNEKDLVTALDEGMISAAYLDVFTQEPLPASSELRAQSSCFLFPHVSAAAPEYMDFFIDELRERTRLKEKGN